MANRLIEGWKNFPIEPYAGPVAMTNEVLIPNTSYSILCGTAVGQALNNYLSVDAEGWLKHEQITGAQYGQRQGIGRLLNSIVPMTATTVLYGGFRYKTPGTQVWQPPALFTIYDRTGLTYQEFIRATDLPGTWAYYTEFYIEWSIDMTTNTLKWRIDRGTEKSVTINASIVTAILAGRACLCWGFGSSPASTNVRYTYLFKDLYVNEKLATGNNNGWVGSMKAVPLYVESVVGQGSVSGAADAVTALNTPLTATSLDTPLVGTDPVQPTIDVKLGMADVSGNVLAVQLSGSARRPPGSLAGMRTALKSGTTTSASTFLPLVQTVRHAQIFLNADATAENKPWTRAEVLATTVKVTASNT